MSSLSALDCGPVRLAAKHNLSTEQLNGLYDKLPPLDVFAFGRSS